MASSVRAAPSKRGAVLRRSFIISRNCATAQFTGSSSTIYAARFGARRSVARWRFSAVYSSFVTSTRPSSSLEKEGPGPDFVAPLKKGTSTANCP